MKFNVTSSNESGGLIQQCETLLGMDPGTISGNSSLLKIFTTNINTYYERVNSWIWESTGDWEYDDSNATTLPIATTNLIIGRSDYEIPTNAQRLERVEVLDVDGNYSLILPIDKSQFRRTAMSELYKTPGMPKFYDSIGRSIILYPAPGSGYVTTQDGLKVYVSRKIIKFTPSNSTQEPGFDEDFHSILALGASLMYAIGYMPNDVNRINNIRADLRAMIKELKAFYGSRHRDFSTKINPKRRNYR